MASLSISTTTPASKAKLDPFEPGSRTVPATSPADSTHKVTIPVIPELLDAKFLDKLFPDVTPSKPAPAANTNAPTNPLMEALKDTGNRQLTQNNSPAFASTKSPTLDAFNGLTAYAEGADVYKLISDAWAEDPSLTLKLIWNLRSIHEGKSDRMVFYRAFGWLYLHHPKTAIANLDQLVEPVIDRPPEKEKDKKGKKEVKMAEDDEEWDDLGEGKAKAESDAPLAALPGYSHGYYKDLLNILSLASTDELNSSTSTFTAIRTERPKWTMLKGAKKAPTTPRTHKPRATRGVAAAKTDTKPDKTNAAAADTAMTDEKKARRPRGENSQQTKARLALEVQKRLTTKLKHDKQFRALYIAVARIFAQKLGADIALLREAMDKATSDQERGALVRQITIVSKWAPSLGQAHDRRTNICTAIAQVLYADGMMADLTGGNFPVGQELGEEACHSLRAYYRRWIVSPLRRMTKVTEVLMAPGHWQHINYERVPSVCMKNNKTQFFKHDEQRFLSYLMEVARGTKMISGAVLLPHELLYEALSVDPEGAPDPAEKAMAKMELDVAEAQWRSIVDRLRESGSLENAIAVADVSGSMGDLSGGRGQKLIHVQPILPCVALSIIIAQLAKPPFDHSFITFSEKPALVTISPTAGLLSIAKDMVRADWGMNTDLNAVFMKLILPLAVEHKIKQEDMIKRLFIFSDMQFDECPTDGAGSWETNYQQIRKAYEEKGYEVPQLVFWNLAGPTEAKPVTKDQDGVALLSGFSPNMLKVFMDGKLDEAIEEEEVKAEEAQKEVEKEKAQEAEDKMDMVEAEVDSEAEGKAKEAEDVADMKVDQGDAATVVEGQTKSGMNPLLVMKKAVERKSYEGLQVFD